MKKGALITLIITLCVFVVSSVASITLLVSGFKSLAVNHTETVSNTVDEIESVTGQVKKEMGLKYNGEKCIRLEDIATEVIVKESASDEVKVELNGSWIGSVPEIKLQSENDEITVSMDGDVNFDSGLDFLSKLLNGEFFDYDLELYDLELVVYIPQSFGGDLEIKNCAGKVKVVNDCNSILINDCAGKVEAKGAYKSVVIEDCAASVEMEITDEFESVVINDTLGSVELTIPKDTKGVVEVRDCLGQVSSDFGVEKSNEDGFDYDGKINGGGDASIKITNCLGKVEIKSA